MTKLPACYRCGKQPCECKDGITLYNCDWQLLGSIESSLVATIFTDPPYSSGARQSAQMRSRGKMRRENGKHEQWIGGDNLSAHGFAMMVRLLAVELFRVSARGGHFFSFIDWRQWPVLHGAIESAGWSARSCLVWDKIHFGMGNGFRQQAEFILHASKGTADNFIRHDLGTVFRHRRDGDDIHPTMKPLPLVRDILSATPDGLVLDPFAGSGTTGRACKDLGRKCIMVEIEEKYCEIAANRLRQEVLF